MERKKLFMHAPVILGILFLKLGIFYLLVESYEYTFVPSNAIALNSFTAAIIVFLVFIGIKHRKEKTKTSVIFSAVVPLLAIFFIISKGVASDIDGIHLYIVYSAFSYIALICSMITFFVNGRGKIVKIGLGIIYYFIMIITFLILFIMSFLHILTFEPQVTVMQSEMSPNFVYLAKIVESNSGAVGGATRVEVTRQKRDINLLIGKVQKNSITIYADELDVFSTMTLQWKTDEILYINEDEYIIKDVIEQRRRQKNSFFVELFK